MAKRLNGNNVIGLVGDASTNYIQQVNDGSVNHAIAVMNGITFFNGKADTTGVTWNGIQDLEVVIPTLADIVSNPVTLKGVIDSASDVPSSPSNGDLYYIGTPGTYFTPQVVCEAGDMAVYYNGAWHVVSGENQVSILGVDNATGVADVALTGTAKDVLTVEGKTLKLSVDYSTAKVTKNAAIDNLNVTNGTVTVPSIHVGLHKATDGSLNISKSESIALPTALASGDVTISKKVLVADDFSWDAGTLPSISLNSAAVSVNITNGMTLDVNASGTDYVSDVVAIKGVNFVAGTASDKSLTYVSGIAPADGTVFFKGIHTTGNNETADFAVSGAPTIDSTPFVYGLGAEAATGDVVSSITFGEVGVGAGSAFLTGTTSSTSTFVSSVTFGDAVQDTNASWFYSGLGEGNDVVTGVTIGATSLISDTNSSFKGNAVVSASVSDHVLSFNVGTFMTPVKISKAADTITTGGFTKSGVKLSGFASETDTFTKGGLVQATTSVSYKSLQTKAVSLTAGSVTSYTFDKEAAKEYSAQISYAKLTTTNADVTKAGYKLGNTSLTGSIPVNTVAVGMSAGTLPSWSAGTATGTLAGTVGTELTTSTVGWLGIDASKQSAVVIPGAYSITSDSADAGIDVAAADTYALDGAKVAIAAGQFVTDVYPDGTNAAGIKA